MLKPRLAAVAAQIQAEVHADIGTDHALLPRFLLQSGRARRVIAVEKHAGPYALACRNLAQWPAAEVRRGDGLAVLEAGEVDCLSVTGIGALNTLHILRAHPERLPSKLVVQPMDEAEPLRRWAYHQGYWLRQEEWVEPHCILAFQVGEGPDPAYAGLPLEAAFHFGPWLLRGGSESFHKRLRRARREAEALAEHGRAKLVLVEAAQLASRSGCQSTTQSGRVSSQVL